MPIRDVVRKDIGQNFALQNVAAGCAGLAGKYGYCSRIGESPFLCVVEYRLPVSRYRTQYRPLGAITYSKDMLFF